MVRETNSPYNTSWQSNRWHQDAHYDSCSCISHEHVAWTFRMNISHVHAFRETNSPYNTSWQSNRWHQDCSLWFMFMHFAWNQRSHSSHCTAFWFARQPLAHRTHGSFVGPGFKLTSPARTTNEAASEMFSSLKPAWSLHNGGKSEACGRRCNPEFRPGNA